MYPPQEEDRLHQQSGAQFSPANGWGEAGKSRVSRGAAFPRAERASGGGYYGIPAWPRGILVPDRGAECGEGHVAAAEAKEDGGKGE